ncbi:fibronectin type III domain-containing protein [Glaciihabitans arcticus]|uniref:fibronectin type III domain-containing protein n=1 Tax=Glaciihabitans arcticus TaxID=2668039 RepID=UPI0013875E57|nr:fibronectin type III domain-containing protein [Glaciihabitans arcticus]
MFEVSRAWVGGTAASALVFGMLIVSPAASAIADTPLLWPQSSLAFEHSYRTLYGINVQTSEISLSVESTDATRADNDYPDYVYEFEIVEAVVPLSAFAAGSFASTSRDNEISVGEWATQDLQFVTDDSYRVRIRLLADGQISPWSAWEEILVLGLDDAPQVIGPSDQSRTQNVPTLEVAVAAPTTPMFAEFRVETLWEEGAPVVLDEGVAEANQFGRAQFEPDLFVDSELDGRFRWQSRSFTSEGRFSVWSDFSEFEVVSLPPAISGIHANQYRNTLTVMWDWPEPLIVEPTETLEVTLSPGDQIFEISAYQNSVDFENMEVGEYEFSITPTNAIGDGPTTRHELTFEATPADAPRDLLVNVAGTAITATWNAPDYDGGSSVLEYRVTVTDCYGEALTTVTTASMTASFSGLEPGCWPHVRVVPITGIGDGSAAIAWFGTYSAPDAPQNPEVRIGDSFLDVYWDAPASDGGGNISHYVIDISPGTESREVVAGLTRQGAHFPNLDNGTQYTFSVRSVNGAGSGPSLSTVARAPESEATDFDQDGVPDIVEERFGSSPLISDSDGDGLSDEQEITRLASTASPASADSDGDGIWDALEDGDEDGLSNAAELAAGTSPSNPDSDDDGIRDADEATELTDPLNPDTDEDGLADGAELRLDFSPLADDSNGDGIHDSEEVTLLELSSPTRELDPENGMTNDFAPTTASLTGIASEVLAYSVAEMPSSDISGAITAVASVQAFELELGGSSFNQARTSTSTVLASLTMGYSPNTQAEVLSNLSPVKWNYSLGTWEFADNDVSVSTSRQTITIDSAELGLRYAIVDLREWASSLSECDLTAGGTPPLDVEIVLDETSSVSTNDDTGERFDALRALIGSLRSGDRIRIRVPWIVGVLGRSAGQDGELAFRSPPPANWYEINSDYQRTVQDDLPYWEAADPETALDYIDALEATFGPGYGYDDSDLFGNQDAMAEIAFGSTWLDTLPRTQSNPFVEDSPVYECRQSAIVLVTDGLWVPPIANSDDPEDGSGDDYFRDRADIPVHVLDVGVDEGQAGSWLIEIADATNGSYSYVPTATDLDGWIDDVTPFDDPQTISKTLDTDEDGLTDWVEIHGVCNSMRQDTRYQPLRYFSDPLQADSDGDGLLDGEELGRPFVSGTRGVLWVSGAPITCYAVVSNPAEEDSDYDNLTDVMEFQLGLNALNGDSDWDQVTDEIEEINGSSSEQPDSDFDSFDDRFEIINVADGYDPTEPTPVVSKWVWMDDFAVGFTCGEMEFCNRGTMAWLGGNIASGLLVFGDVRDMVALASRGDWVGAGLCAVGLIPGFGDAIGTSAKIVKFLKRLSSPLSQARGPIIPPQNLLRMSMERSALTALAIATKVPAVFVREMRNIDPHLVDALQSRDVGDLSIMKLVPASGTTRLNALIAASVPSALTGPQTRKFMLGGKSAEIANVLAAGPGGKTQRRIPVTYLNSNQQLVKSTRIIDYALTPTSNSVHGLEAVVGYAGSAFKRNQVLKEKLLDAQVEFDFSSAWHFWPSGANYKIGPSLSTLELMQDPTRGAVIDVVMEWPH